MSSETVTTSLPQMSAVAALNKDQVADFLGKTIIIATTLYEVAKLVKETVILLKK